MANNIPAIPLYYALCQGLTPREQHKLCITATLTSCITMIASVISGAGFLNFFDISVAAFRVAGGILLLFSGINMINSKEELTLSSDNKHFSEVISVAVIPIAIPLTTGAGTISTLIVFSEGLRTWVLAGKLFGAVLLMTLAIYFSFRYSITILRLLGHTGMNVLTKIFGIITLALGVQFILSGLLQTFPNLAK